MAALLLNVIAEIAAAFNATVKPKIDEALLAKVRMKKWLRPEDFN